MLHRLSVNIVTMIVMEGSWLLLSFTFARAILVQPFNEY